MALSHRPLLFENHLLLVDEAGNRLPPIPIGSRAWYSWLAEEQHRSFSFRNHLGTCTVRRERQRHGWYWYAYRKRAGNLHKAYLGKTEEITLDRLNSVAATLAGQDEIGEIERSYSREPKRDTLEGVDHLSDQRDQVFPFPLSPDHSPAEPRQAPRQNLPVMFTPLIGREQEIAAVSALLRQPEVRLLTLLGTGGVGKTRLGLAVATDLMASFTDGACFVSLVPLSDPSLVVPTIAQVLDVTERAGQSLFEQLQTALQKKRLLLLLDNFEQVAEAGPHLLDLLVACPHLKLLVTSRAPLRIQGEQQYPVPPLALPDLKQLSDDDDLMQYAAVALFVKRLQTIRPDFQMTVANARTIAEVCVRLDGLPLAIELAAARSKLLSPQVLLARLSHRLALLTSGTRDAPARQQTLRNTMKWSYDLLGGEEKRIFRRLAVFVGGCTLEAAEALCSTPSSGESILECVTSLIDMSLVQSTEREGGGEVRLLMLETIREYALECLEASGEAEAIRTAHAHYYLTLSEEAEPELKGVRQELWRVRLEVEQDNLRAAFWWLIEREEAEPALRFCGALRLFWGRTSNVWDERGWHSEGRRWLEAALALRSPENPTVAQARALLVAGELAYIQNDNDTARLYLEESIALSRGVGYMQELAMALGILASLVYQKEGRAAAGPLFEESEELCRSLGRPWELAGLLGRIALYVLWEGRLQQAVDYAQEGLALAKKLGDRSLAANTLTTLGAIAARQGDILQAIAYNRESLALVRELNAKNLIALTLNNVAYFTALQEGQPRLRAAEEARDALKLARELGDRLQVTRTLHTLGLIALRQDDFQQAALWYREGLSQALELDSSEGIGWNIFGLALIAEAKGQFLKATQLFGTMERRLQLEAEMSSIEQAEYRRAIQVLRTRLGEKGFTAAWNEGYGMTVEQMLSAQGSSVYPPNPSPPSPANSRSAYPDNLTGREIEVLRLVAGGLTNEQVAEQLVISPRTVNTHLTSIYGKIGVSSRSAATRYAMERHLV